MRIPSLFGCLIPCALPAAAHAAPPQRPPAPRPPLPGNVGAFEDLSLTRRLDGAKLRISSENAGAGGSAILSLYAESGKLLDRRATRGIEAVRFVERDASRPLLAITTRYGGTGTWGRSWTLYSLDRNRIEALLTVNERDYHYDYQRSAGNPDQEFWTETLSDIRVAGVKGSPQWPEIQRVTESKALVRGRAGAEDAETIEKQTQTVERYRFDPAAYHYRMAPAAAPPEGSRLPQPAR